MENKVYYLTYVVGDRGVGKTTLLAHFATQYMIPPRSIEDLRLCRKEIERLRTGGWTNMSLEPHVQHLVYVVDETFIAKGLGYKPRISMELEFEKIGLYDCTNEVSYLLPYAKLFMPEVQSKLDSRKSITPERVSDSFLRWLERQRKVGIQVWADTQIDDSADKRFRSMADKVIEVQGRKNFYDKRGRILKTVWTCLEFEGLRAYTRYKENGKLKEAAKMKYTHIGNIYDCVDSFSGREYFYNGMSGNFHTPLAKPTGYSKEAMLEKCARYPLIREKPKKEA